MPNDRENEPKIKIIDRRMLSEEERTGKIITSANQAEPNEAPKLEIIGGGRPTEPVQAPAETPAPAASESLIASAPTSQETEEDIYDLDGEEALTDEQAEQMRQEIEQEQFDVLEKQFGRPLTEEEKTQVRAMMDQQAQSMTRLEVAPLLLRSLTELPSYAVVHLGLRPNPYTGLIARNDAEARLAIDSFGAVYDIIKNKVDPRAGAELARVLNDLRANYQRITGLTLTAPGGPRIIH